MEFKPSKSYAYSNPIPSAHLTYWDCTGNRWSECGHFIGGADGWGVPLDCYSELIPPKATPVSEPSFISLQCCARSLHARAKKDSTFHAVFQSFSCNLSEDTFRSAHVYSDWTLLAEFTNMQASRAYLCYTLSQNAWRLKQLKAVHARSLMNWDRVSVPSIYTVSRT